MEFENAFKEKDREIETLKTELLVIGSSEKTRDEELNELREQSRQMQEIIAKVRSEKKASSDQYVKQLEDERRMA